eukprot:4405143-Prymnesium_polylepis.1
MCIRDSHTTHPSATFCSPSASQLYNSPHAHRTPMVHTAHSCAPVYRTKHAHTTCHVKQAAGRAHTRGRDAASQTPSAEGVAAPQWRAIACEPPDRHQIAHVIVGARRALGRGRARQHAEPHREAT